MRPLILFILLSTAWISASTGGQSMWNCDEPTWAEEAELRDGRFHGRIAVSCRVDLSRDADFSALREYLVRSVLAADRVHAAGVDRFEITRKMIDDGDALEIREEAWLTGDGKSALGFASRSREVRGEGMSSYLRRFDFSASFVRTEPRRVTVALDTRLEIERPWYALAPLFVPIARAKARGKFLKRVEELMPIYSERLRDGA